MDIEATILHANEQQQNRCLTFARESARGDFKRQEKLAKNYQLHKKMADSNWCMH